MFFTPPKDITTWKDGQNILAIPEIIGNIVHLKNIRDFDYGDGTTESIQAYLDDSYPIKSLRSCTIYSIPFGKWNLFSHLILGFTFDDDRELLLSVEARRRPGEDFSVAMGFLPYYGLIYIWGTREDLIGLRLHARGDTVYSYSMTFNPEMCQKIFLDCITRTKMLTNHPEIYGSFFNNCTTNIVKHCTDCFDLPYPSLDYRVILSGKIEGYLREMGWVGEVVKMEEDGNFTDKVTLN